MRFEGLLPIVYAVLLAYFFTAAASYIALIVTGVVVNRRRNRQVHETDFARLESSPLTVPVSVLVPAYNEEAGIVDTIRSVLASRFPEFEVIAIDDGSTDGTYARLAQAFALEPHMRVHPETVPTRQVTELSRSRTDPRLWVIRKQNGGKSDALNAGLNLARYRYVVMTDADGIFSPDALSRMSRELSFAPERIVALGPTLRLLNGSRVEHGRIVERRLPKEWVVRFQMVEYATVFLAQRLGWSAVNAVPVVSGGAAAWRKDVLREMGGFPTNTTHEDLDLTLAVHQAMRARRQAYDIAYVPDPVVYTEVPHTWRGVFSQRKRWQRTLFESVWRQRRMWLNPRYGVVGLLQMPYLLLYEALGPFIELFAYALTITLYLLGFVSLELLLAFLLISAALNAIVRLTGLTLDLVFYERLSFGQVLRLGAAALLEMWVYRPFLLPARLIAFFEFLAGRTTHEKAERIDRGHPSLPRAA